MGIRCADSVTPLYPQKLALTSPTGGGRSVGIVRSRTKATEFLYTASFSMKTLHVLPTQCMDVFWMDLRTNNDGFPTRHELIILRNWGRVFTVRYEMNLWIIFRLIVVCPHRGPGLIPGPLVWDLWCTKWHQEMVFSEHFCFSPVTIFSPRLHTQPLDMLYQKQHWVKSGNLSKINASPGIGEH
jgi:hypothetical protein